MKFWCGPSKPCGRSITGYGQEDDRKRAKEAGFNQHLTKPADPVELAQLLSRRDTNGSLRH
jgi:CheY-like chemotaxis protein